MTIPLLPDTKMLDRFWTKVVAARQPNEFTGTPCWLWAASVRDSGYGQFSIDDRPRAVHRISYTWAYGVIPSGLTLDHLCRQKRCVRPDHLEAVTRLENTLRARDSYMKLSDSDVREVRRLRTAGSSLQQIAQLFNVDQSTISLIARGKRRQTVT